MATKVLFQPLERLDIVDVEGLQNLAHSAGESLAGALLGENSAGLAEGFSTLTIDTLNDRIYFGDFSFVGRMVDSEGNGKHRPAWLGKFSSANPSNGDCVFATYRSLVQAYYNTNGVLPPSPTSASFDAALHGSFYPYIFVRPVVTEGSAASRRVWDVSSNSEVTSSINTRSAAHYEFTLATMFEGTPVSDNEFAWTRIASIKLWDLNVNTVRLTSFGVARYFFSDNMIGVAGAGRVAEDTHSAAVRTGGVGGAISWILAHIDAMKSGGTADVAARPSVARYNLPLYSMSDLGYRLDELTDTVAALKLVESATAMVSISFNADYPTITQYTNLSNTFPINVYLDYKPARDFLSRTEGVDVGAFGNTEWLNYFSSTAFNIMLLGSLALEVPDAYRNKQFMLSVEPIYADRGGEFFDSGNARNDALRYHGFKQAEAWHILSSSPGTINATRVITARSRQTKDSSTDIVFTGINIGQRGAVDWTDLDAYSMRFDLKITLAILNQ